MASSVAFAQPVPSALDTVRKLETDLNFDSMYPRRSYLGKTAAPQGWSHDDRFLAYTWNPYDIRSSDLFLFDSRSGKTERLTSIEMMAKFDRDSKLAIDFIKKDDERITKWDGLSDNEWRTERQKFKEEQEKKKKPDPSYPGIGGIAWAKKSNEFLMLFRGDIWRWKVGESAPKRITQTREAEFNIEYLPDDSGFVFRRGNGVYKIKFGSEFVRQINPELPDGAEFGGYSLSPDGTKMLVTGSKPGAPDRQVDWISYRERFAQAKKTARGVAEDDFQGQTLMYLFDITDKALDDVDSDQKPYEFYKWAGGEEWQYFSISDNPWSPDGSNLVYSSYKRDKREWKIQEVNPRVRNITTLWEGKSDGEHQTPQFTQPFYTADGKNVVALLDKSGWRQVHLINRATKAETQLTKGDYETYPLQLSADKKSILVRSSKESLARRNLYRVSLSTGEMTNLTTGTGVYTEPTIAHKSDKMASVFSSWNNLREMVVLDGGKEQTITESHKKDAFWKNIKLKPELFTFKNRHGDDVQGFMFLPPGLNERSSKRPLFIYVYGGPLGQGNSVVDGAFGSSEYMFNQYLAYTLGYVTVVLDPRGSSGYNARFGKSNFDNPGVGQTEDLSDCVKFMESKYPIDMTRVGLTGWSFGGWQTQHAMYTAPEVFTLGIAGAGPTEWQNYNSWYTGGVIGNTPKNDPLYLDKYSLTKFAGNLKSPLLLLHGIEDTNVLFQDTIHIYRKLLQAGKGPLVELALDPTGAHGMGGDMDTRDRHAIYLEFIAKHWGAKKAD
ncbi:MAG: prolyl oligopeptidase family serine peptidase [Armatimonadetes bacterium]|nr:prolyl oligopeptidase family serine peptidase [Armatimonadota bacterium]